MEKARPGSLNYKSLFYSAIADEFDTLVNPYDLSRRLEVIFDELLVEDITGKALLDMGCATGWFSKKAAECGANVTSLDISQELILFARQHVPTAYIVGSALSLPFSDVAFDIVISSDVIEHTPNPRQAVLEMGRVLKSGGILALICPNQKWNWLVHLASQLRCRPFQGHENFPGFDELEDLRKSGLVRNRHFVFHPWPFQLEPLWGWSFQVDRQFGNGIWGRFMLNQAVRVSKS